MTRQCFAKGIMTFLTLFDNVKMSKAKQTICYDMLKDLSDKQFEYAILKICADTKDYYPNTNFVALVRDQLTVDMGDRAIAVWTEVVKAMEQKGAYRSVKFDDPVIHSVIEVMGGWAELCGTPIDKWLRKEFIDNYTGLQTRNDHPDYCMGIMEKENRINGYLSRAVNIPTIDTGYIGTAKQLKGKTGALRNEFSDKLLSKMKVTEIED